VSNQPYHKYVFNVKKRKYVGKFEKMYQSEEKENFDSWNQEDMTHLGKQICQTILAWYNFNSILDLGCGKGTFTHLLRKSNNYIVGIDLSKTAIKKAKIKYKNVNFICSSVYNYLKKRKNWDLIVAIELFSYLKNWKEIIKLTTKRTKYFFIALYLPEKPIGFVKSFDELKNEINKYFNIEHEFFWQNRREIFIMAVKK